MKKIRGERDLASIPGLRAEFQEVVSLIRRLAPEGLQEVWGAKDGMRTPDFRLNYDRYLVIAVYQQKTFSLVLVYDNHIFENRHLYADDPDFDAFEDAWGYFDSIKKMRGLRIYPDADFTDPYLETFLESGMRLHLKEVKRRHPQVAKK